MRKDTELKQLKKYKVASHYSDSTFRALYEIFVTYRNRGGILSFTDFANIPIKKDPGENLEDEPGYWTKGIRTSLATQGILDYDLS